MATKTKRASSKRRATISPAVIGTPWACREDVLRTLATTRATVPAGWSAGDDDADAGYQLVGDVAVIQLVGAIQKYADIWQQIFGGVSTVDAGVALAAAQADPAVGSILLAIDSPGGEVSGTGDFAAAVANCAKPVTAYVSDMACSAAYWIASQADQIIANPTAFVGSIGVYCVVADTSRLYEDAGVRINLVKAGASKGVGVDGVPVTDDQLLDVQRTIDAIYDAFVSAVAQGRGLSVEESAALATGQTWMAPEAMDLGLIDAVGTLENTLTILQGETDMPRKIKIVKNANINVETPAPAAEAVEAPVAEAVEKIVANVEAPVVEVVAAALPTLDLRAEGYAAGVKAEQDRLAELEEMAGEHPAFVLEQFRAGNSLAVVAKAFAALVKGTASSAATKAAELATLDPSNGIKALNTRPSGSLPAAGDADADWAANRDNCQSNFGSLKDFKAFRAWQDKVAKSAK